MSRTSQDGVRSLGRYLYESLGDPWSIFYGRDEGIFTRPCVVVRAIGSVISSGAAHTFDVTQPFVLHVYPEEKPTTHEAQDEMLRVQELILQAFQVGTMTWRRVGRFSDRTGHARRVPLYNYAGIPHAEAGPANPEGWMRVVDFNVNPQQDDQDERHYVLVCNLRATWRKRGERATSGRPVTSVPITREIS